MHAHFSEQPGAIFAAKRLGATQVSCRRRNDAPGVRSLLFQSAGVCSRLMTNGTRRRTVAKIDVPGLGGQNYLSGISGSCRSHKSTGTQKMETRFSWEFSGEYLASQPNFVFHSSDRFSFAEVRIAAVMRNMRGDRKRLIKELTSRT